MADEKRSRGRPKKLYEAHKRSVSFPPSLYEALEAIARRDQYNTVNDLVIFALREFVRQDSEKKPGNFMAVRLAARSART